MAILKAVNNVKNDYRVFDFFDDNIDRYTVTKTSLLTEDRSVVYGVLVWFKDKIPGNKGHNGYLKDVIFESSAEGHLFVGVLKQVKKHIGLTQELVKDLASSVIEHGQVLRDHEKKMENIFKDALSLMGGEVDD